ncbi:MAG: class I SAM-dependent methyltransferase [Gammaproteobacteria bacterium]|nr:class I SAM-dependent methyltransferase [Gammaproteobacteria bacterium]
MNEAAKTSSASPAAACICCGGHGESTLFSAPAFDGDGTRYTLVQCRHCGLARTEPRPSGEALAGYYAPDYYGSGERKFHPLLERFIAALTARRARALLTLAGTGTDAAARVLDVGCGRGTLLGAFHSLGCECHGVERVDFPLDRLAPGVRLHRGELDALALPEAHFDVVVYWHVLEHLPAPFESLAQARRLLRPGGILAVAVPNLASLQASLFEAHWFHLDLPRHLYHFPLATLRTHLATTGYEVVHASTWSADQNVFGFVQSALNVLSPRRANRLYALLRRPAGARAALLSWSLAALVLMPAALAEALVAGVLGRGATATLYARRAA